MTMFKGRKRIFAEEPQSSDRWLKEPRNNHPEGLGFQYAGAGDYFPLQLWGIASATLGVFCEY